MEVTLTPPPDVNGARRSSVQSEKHGKRHCRFLAPDVVPMWGQIEESDYCCGFTVTTTNATNWPVATHGSLELNNEKNCKEGQLTKVHTFSFSCTSVKLAQRNAMHAVRLPKNTEGSAEKSGTEKKERRRDKHVCPEIPKCDACCDAGLASSPDLRRSACRALNVVSSPLEARGAHVFTFFLQ